MTVRGGEECCSMHMAMCSQPRVQWGAGLQEGAILYRPAAEPDKA